MSYSSMISSTESATPVDCYRISDREASVDHLLTSSNVPVALESSSSGEIEIYLPATIQRTSVKYTAKKSVGTLDITITEDATSAVSDIFGSFQATSSPPVIHVEVIRAFRHEERTEEQIQSEYIIRQEDEGDPEDALDYTDYRMMMPFTPVSEQRRVWSGRLSNYNLSDRKLKLILSAVGDQSLRNVPGRKYSWACGHIWSAPIGCQVDKDLYYSQHFVESADDGKVLLDTGNTLPQDGAPLSAFTTMSTDDQYFVGGWVEAASDTGTSKRFIMAAGREDGTNQPWLQLSMPFFSTGFTFGNGNDTIKIYAGCNRSPEACRDKFNNLDNYGGFPHVPDWNPFLGAKGVRPEDNVDPIVITPNIFVDPAGDIEP